MIDPASRDPEKQQTTERSRPRRSVLTPKHNAHEAFPEPPAQVEMTDEGFEVLVANGGVRKKTLRRPHHPETEDTPAPIPKRGQEITVHYKGWVKERGASDAFDDSRDRGAPFKFVLGEGRVITAWDVAVASMRVGDVALVECTSEYGYGDEGHAPAIPGGATLCFEIEVLGVGDKKKELFEMTKDDKVAAATRAKTQGLERFAAGDVAGARDLFEEACYYCDVASFARDAAKKLPADVAALYSSCQLNAAQCGLNAQDWPVAARAATSAMLYLPRVGAAATPMRVKALYRRGVARSRMGLLGEARADLVQAAKLDPKNRPVRQALANVKALAADQGEAQKAVFKKAFDKVDLFPDKPTNVHNPSETANPYAFLEFAAAAAAAQETASSAEQGDAAVAADAAADATRDAVGGGTVVVRVYADACPRTARNFLALCAGDRGVSKHSARRLHYKGTRVTRVVADLMLQAGDVACDDGSSGESIYGRHFADEHFKIKHDAAGVLSMANAGKDSNASQFFITVDEAPHCDGRYVAFGKVVAGLDVVKRIATLPADETTQRPLADVRIVNCGVMAAEDAKRAMLADAESRLARAAEAEGAAPKKAGPETEATAREEARLRDIGPPPIPRSSEPPAGDPNPGGGEPAADPPVSPGIADEQPPVGEARQEPMGAEPSSSDGA